MAEPEVDSGGAAKTDEAMMNVDTVVAWIAIGMAASLAAMIWPFQRGAFGVFINFAMGVTGAVVGGTTSHLVMPPSSNRGSALQFLCAAVGALAALGLAHWVWSLRLGSASARR